MTSTETAARVAAAALTPAPPAVPVTALATARPPVRWFHSCPRPRCSHGEVSIHVAPNIERCPLHDVPVVSERLIVERDETQVCDAECTSARKALCQCSCGGTNHGVQRMDVEVGARARGAASFVEAEDRRAAAGDTRPRGFRCLPAEPVDEPW